MNNSSSSFFIYCSICISFCVRARYKWCLLMESLCFILMSARTLSSLIHFASVFVQALDTEKTSFREQCSPALTPAHALSYRGRDRRGELIGRRECCCAECEGFNLQIKRVAEYIHAVGWRDLFSRGQKRDQKVETKKQQQWHEKQITLIYGVSVYLTNKHVRILTLV